MPLLAREMGVAAFPQPGCVVMVAICSSPRPACYHTVHCLKEINNYGKLMPFGYFLRRIASWNLILFFFFTCTKNVGDHCCPITEMVLINLNNK